MGMVSVAGQRRPVWKRAAGRVLKRVVGWRFRRFRPDAQPERWVRIAGVRLRVLPGVFNPALHFTSGFLATYLRGAGVVGPGSRVLDLGTGSGVAAIAAARAGAGCVLATDINPEAVMCAAGNVRRLGLQELVRVREGDLFEPVRGERFDLIVCNPPYFRGSPRNMAERAYRAGPNFEWMERLAVEAADYLAGGGSLLLVLGDAADLPGILARFEAAGWRVAEVARRDILIEVLHIFCLEPAVDRPRGVV